MHDFQAQYVIRTTAEQVTQPITSPHYSLLILEGLNKRKKSKVYLRLFQDVQYFCHNKKVEIKGKFLNNLLLLFLVAISIRSPLPTLRVHPTRSISLPVSQGCSPKKKMLYLLKEKVFFVFRVSHPIAPLAVCLLQAIQICVISCCLEVNTSKLLKAFEPKTTLRTALISRLDLSQTENSQIL